MLSDPGLLNLKHVRNMCEPSSVGEHPHALTDRRGPVDWNVGLVGGLGMVNAMMTEKKERELC